MQARLDHQNTEDRKGDGYNIYQALSAVGSGGLSGKGYLEPLEIDFLSAMYKDLSAISKEERAKKYRLRYDRADVIVPAGRIYLSILEKCGIKEIIVPKIGLSDGIAYYLHKEHS